jgi:hypothetical protein
MKTIITILLLFQLTFNVNGQIRLNSNKSEIKSEFFESKYSLEEMNIDGIDAISIFTDRANILYMFNSNNVCKISILVPHTQGDLNYFVESYNNRYVILSDNEWKMYTENGIAEIKLLYDADKPAFRWTIN